MMKDSAFGKLKCFVIANESPNEAISAYRLLRSQSVARNDILNKVKED